MSRGDNEVFVPACLCIHIFFGILFIDINCFSVSDAAHGPVFSSLVHIELQTAVDNGGPRKNLFRSVMQEIKEKYFSHRLLVLLCKDYEVIGGGGGFVF